MAKKQNEAVKLVNSLFEVEKHFLELLLDFVPEEARKHLRAARKEKLLAVHYTRCEDQGHREKRKKQRQKKTTKSQGRVTVKQLKFY